MASTTSSQPGDHKDPTFRNYDTASAKKYLQHRGGYTDRLIDLVMSHHTSSGGGVDLLLDVGCGPGNATRSLAVHFQHAIGADPGQSMIETAKTVPSATKSGEEVTYEVCAAESLSSLSTLKGYSNDGHGSVDLITAAMAAHWFDMPRFWAEAAKVLKPGGSVIIWCHGGYTVDPNTTPNAVKLQDFMKKFEEETIAPYELPGNRLCRELYINLGMPWECLDRIHDGDQEVRQLLGEFPENEFVRLVFNKDGRVPPGESFFSGGRRTELSNIKQALGTSSPVTRWREANKAKVESGEIGDILDVLVSRIREIMEEVEEGKGREYIEAGSASVFLVVKKRK